MTVQELKAVAYDIMNDVQNFQNNLRIVQNEIAKRNKEAAENPKPQ